MHRDERGMRTFALTLASLAFLAPARATTLVQLSLSDMILQSSSIVHAKVTGSYAAARGAQIYTFYQLQVSETLKPAGQNGSAAASAVQVAVPGGAANGVRQMVPGAPELTVGNDYILFLWTSRSGLTQVIGLSQGLFKMTQDESGNKVLLRPASTELMLDKNGSAVTNQSTTLLWSNVRSQIVKTLGGN